MKGIELPNIMFETGYEPTRIKWVIIYFNLRWLELIKIALEDEHLALQNDSQFRKIAFSVIFVHYILSRQLLTGKEFELWWLFTGKPIRFAIQDFALVTSMNCAPNEASNRDTKGSSIVRGKGNVKVKGSTSSAFIWDSLFRGEDKPTPGWIMDRLILGKKYKDPLTWFRLALLVIVEGIMCPTCGITKIRPEVVKMLDNVDDFLHYPWGRESFLLTVKSTKARSPKHYVQGTIAIPGFVHAMFLVTVTACPTLIVKSGSLDPLLDEGITTEDRAGMLLERKLVVNVVSAKTMDKKGEANVCAFVSEMKTISTVENNNE